jgi:hypothetical protein
MGDTFVFSLGESLAGTDVRYGSRPIFDDQAWDSGKLSHIVDDQGQAHAASVSCYGQIVRTDHGAQLSKVSAYLSIVQRCVVGKIKDVEVIQKGVERGLILLPPGRNFDSEQQLRLRDHGDADIVDGKRDQALEHSIIRALHDVGANIGVEHVTRHLRLAFLYGEIFDTFHEIG